MSETRTLNLPFILFQNIQLLANKLKTPPQELLQMLVREKIQALDAGAKELESPTFKWSKTETSRHQHLKRIASDYLKEAYGFTVNEIHFEYQVPSGWVDVAGVNGRLRIAVEVGNVTMTRLLLLYRYFDDVIWIPYWLHVTTGEETIDALVRRRVSVALSEQKRLASRAAIHQENELERKAREEIQIARRVVAMVFTECRDNDLKIKLGQVAKPLLQTQFTPEDFGQARLREQHDLLALEELKSSEEDSQEP